MSNVSTLFGIGMSAEDVAKAMKDIRIVMTGKVFQFSHTERKDRSELDLLAFTTLRFIGKGLVVVIDKGGGQTELVECCFRYNCGRLFNTTDIHFPDDMFDTLPCTLVGFALYTTNHQLVCCGRLSREMTLNKGDTLWFRQEAKDISVL